jgi:hypothetical protein
MRALLLAAIFTIPNLYSQRISAVVVDVEENPVEGASIDHAGKQRPITDANGRFELDTNAPIFVIRKPGFRSALVRTETAQASRITIQKLRETMVFPTCSGTTGRIGIKGSLLAQFWFPKIHGIVAGPVGGDDYARRFYYVKTIQGPKGIDHGSGVHWGSGLPHDQDVWRSAKYDEIVYVTADHSLIIDARGEFQNGNRWRSLGKPGETASYSDVGPGTAKILDKVLDGACLGPLRLR